MQEIRLWKGAGKAIPKKGPAGIFGIVNVTPDSFFDGGLYSNLDSALLHAAQLVQEGADVLDIGGASSRPGSEEIDEATETARVLPAIQELAKSQSVPVSVDTWRAGVAAKALEAGASIVNDISACSFDPGLLDVLVSYKPAYVLMHAKGRPKDMQKNPRYEDPLAEVTAFFEDKMSMLVRAGLPEENILLDPGIGFGKMLEHNLALMANPEAWSHLGRPSLMSLSMKSLFQDLLGLEKDKRGGVSATATALCFEAGYEWHRVHEVAKAKDSLALAFSFLQARRRR